MLNDTYRYDLFYYGFIVKYWPQITKEVFKDYILDDAKRAVGKTSKYVEPESDKPSILDIVGSNFHKLSKCRADSITVPYSSNRVRFSISLLIKKPDIDSGISRLKIVPEVRSAKDKIVAALVSKYPRVN